jgi:hypothetical protein
MYNMKYSHKITHYVEDSLVTGKYTNNPYVETIGEVNLMLISGFRGYVKGEFSDGKLFSFALHETLVYDTKNYVFAYAAKDDLGTKITIAALYGYTKVGVMREGWELQIAYKDRRFCFLFEN